MPGHSSASGDVRDSGSDPIGSRPADEYRVRTAAEKVIGARVIWLRAAPSTPSNVQ